MTVLVSSLNQTFAFLVSTFSSILDKSKVLGGELVTIRIQLIIRDGVGDKAFQDRWT